MSFVLVPRRSADAPMPEPPPPDPAVADTAALEADIAQRVGQEVARLRAQAEAEGRAQGEAQARDAAQAQTAAALEPAIAALREAWTQLTAPLTRKEQELAELVTDLSFSLARHIVGAEVNANADSLKSLVARLIQEAASECGPRQSIVVRLNPADRDLLDPVVQIDNAHLLADAAVSRGGAVIEIIAPDGDPIDKIEWDATIETRIELVRAALALRGARHGGGSAGG